MNDAKSDGNRADNFSVGRLMEFLAALGQDVRITVKPKRKRVGGDGSGRGVKGAEEIAVKKGDFWRTPGNVPHTMRAGAEGARVLDIFSPPRAEYRKPRKGFGSV